MFSFFKKLPEKGIDPADIRRLIALDISKEDVQGVISSLSYWGCEWRGKRIPLPLRVVYCYEHLRLIALPFFDKTIDQKKLWGIALGNLVILKKAFPRTVIYMTSDILRSCSYEIYQSWPAGEHSSYGVHLPTPKDMHLILENYQYIRKTIDALHFHGVEFDDFDGADYWTQELEEPRIMSISEVDENHVLVRQSYAEAKECMVRPVINLCDGYEMDFIGSFNKYGIPDKKSEKYARKLR